MKALAKVSEYPIDTAVRELDVTFAVVEGALEFIGDDELGRSMKNGLVEQFLRLRVALQPLLLPGKNFLSSP